MTKAQEWNSPRRSQALDQIEQRHNVPEGVAAIRARNEAEQAQRDQTSTQEDDD